MNVRRIGLLLLVVCRLASDSHAGTVTLAWKQQVAWQDGGTYVLTLVRESQGVLSKTQQTLPLLPRTTCATLQDPRYDPQQTLCAELCLDPGTYSMTIRESVRGMVTPDSAPALRADLTMETPCRPLTVVPPPKPGSPPTKLPAGSIAVGVVAGAGTVLLTQGASPPALTQLPNLNCVQWKIVGPCVCGFPPHPCLTVEYWEPGWLVETVKKPGSSVLSALAPFLDAALAPVTGLMGGGGAGNAPGTGHTNLHYTEAHVYTLPQPLGGPCTSCAPSPALPLLNYASELDAVSWRQDRATPSPLDALLRVGTWGPLYARSGKSIVSSEPVASGLATTRAMDIAAQPVGTPPNVEAHVVVAPTGEKSRCLQMAWPKQTGCMPAGTPSPLWEQAAVSPNGSYVWLIWHRHT